LKNPKSENRNSKQIRIKNDKNSKPNASPEIHCRLVDAKTTLKFLSFRKFGF
jgi:hypothetical protein